MYWQKVTVFPFSVIFGRRIAFLDVIYLYLEVHFFPFKQCLSVYSGSQYKDNINLKEFWLTAHFIVVHGD